VHGGHRVEELRIDQLQTGLEELRADDEGHEAADEEHDAREHQVHRADVLVVGRVHPAAPAVNRAVVIVFAVSVVVVSSVFVCHV
jgi:hypothetical protein